MVMSRWDPFSEALSLREAMNHLFEQAVLQPSGDGGQRSSGGFAPALDVCESKDEFLVEASLPGIDPKDVEIELEKGVLTIKGEINDEQHHQQHQKQTATSGAAQAQPHNGSQSPQSGGGQGQPGQHSGMYHMRERRMGRFFRSITLPTAVNADRAEATFHNGILTLRIPKAEETKPRRIQIQTGGASQQGGTAQVHSGTAPHEGGTTQVQSGTGSQAGGKTAPNAGSSTRT